MTAELIACPFCGGGVKRILDADAKEHYGYKCRRCGARTDWYPSESDALEAWNRRYPL